MRSEILVFFTQQSDIHASVTSAGVPVCLAGCIALAILLDYKQGFRAGVTSIFIAFAVAMFGLFLFPIHFPSGAVYFSLLGVTFGASFVFVSVGSIRYFSNRIRFTHGKHWRSKTFPVIGEKSRSRSKLQDERVSWWVVGKSEVTLGRFLAESWIGDGITKSASRRAE
jgi:hypothetical protein